MSELHVNGTLFIPYYQITLHYIWEIINNY